MKAVAKPKFKSGATRCDGLHLGRLVQRELKGWTPAQLTAQIDGKSAVDRIEDKIKIHRPLGQNIPAEFWKNLRSKHWRADEPAVAGALQVRDEKEVVQPGLEAALQQLAETNTKQKCTEKMDLWWRIGILKNQKELVRVLGCLLDVSFASRKGGAQSMLQGFKWLVKQRAAERYPDEMRAARRSFDECLARYFHRQGKTIPLKLFWTPLKGFAELAGLDGELFDRLCAEEKPAARSRDDLDRALQTSLGGAMFAESATALELRSFGEALKPILEELERAPRMTDEVESVFWNAVDGLVASFAGTEGDLRQKRTIEMTFLNKKIRPEVHSMLHEAELGFERVYRERCLGRLHGVQELSFEKGIYPVAQPELEAPGDANKIAMINMSRQRFQESLAGWTMSSESLLSRLATKEQELVDSDPGFHLDSCYWKAIAGTQGEEFVLASLQADLPSERNAMEPLEVLKKLKAFEQSPVFCMIGEGSRLVFQACVGHSSALVNQEEIPFRGNHGVLLMGFLNAIKYTLKFVNKGRSKFGAEAAEDLWQEALEMKEPDEQNRALRKLAPYVQLLTREHEKAFRDKVGEQGRGLKRKSLGSKAVLGLKRLTGRKTATLSATASASASSASTTLTIFGS